MATTSRRTRYFFSLLLALFLAFFPAQVGAVGAADIPSLEEFIQQVRDGKAESLRGIYVPGIFASRVVPQPGNDSGYVSSQENTLTQFRLADGFGSTGLLAHSDLAGKDFSRLKAGQSLTLVYGDGRTETFIVRRTLRFWALDPEDSRSLFFDLNRGGFLTAAELFLKVYGKPGRAVLQTCIETRDEPSWGRLFVIAEPDHSASK